jgi:hypothetical protein
MCPVPPSGKRLTKKNKQAAKPKAEQWEDIPIDEVHYFDGEKHKPQKPKSQKAPAYDLKRFSDWDLKGVLIVPPDDPRVKEAIEFTKQFIYTKEEYDLFPDNPTEEEAIRINKQILAKRRASAKTKQ